MEEEFSNHSDNQTFEEVLNGYMSRRQLIVGGVAGAALMFMGGSKVSALDAKPTSGAALAKRAKIGLHPFNAGICNADHCT
jgi:secreted PhoX family phosphatase